MTAKDLTHKLGGVWHGHKGQAPCPVCQTERRQDQTALSISDADGKLLLHCFKNNCDFSDIIRASGEELMNAEPNPQEQVEHQKQRAEYREAQLAKAQSFWDRAHPIDNTKAETYLRARGITCAMPKTLRFLGDVYHAPSATWACAMVAFVDPTGGIHRTFFEKNGRRMQKSPKLMLGPCAGGAVRLQEAPGQLVVSEGIETGLSLASGFVSGAASIWATLSTSGMKALELPKQAGELIIATDGDPAGREAGEKLANRACGLGWKVGMMPAPDGKDWNDVLLETEGAF